MILFLRNTIQQNKKIKQFKKWIKTKVSYTPTSLLPLESKDFLLRNELLYICQSDFRANWSPNTCLSQLRDIIFNGDENGKHTGMILIEVHRFFR